MDRSQLVVIIWPELPIWLWCALLSQLVELKFLPLVSKHLSKHLRVKSDTALLTDVVTATATATATAAAATATAAPAALLRTTAVNVTTQACTDTLDNAQGVTATTCMAI